MVKKIIENNKKTIFIVLAIISFNFLFFVKPVAALEAIDAVITSVLGGIAIVVTSVCGWILGKVIAAVISIAGYNGFIHNPQIRDAWIIVRDLCNMFFVLVLLIIAFATILRVENYSMKKWLPKLVMMAVLINFSRTICGLMIDFSQVIMLTFVNAFSDGGGNFASYLKIKEFLELAKNTGDWKTDNSIDLQATVVGMMIAVLFMVIATIAMLAILVVFVMRVIMFWIYIVLSPLAFLLSAFPGGQKYASQYWGEFTRYLINGPVLAFFIWLSLTTMGSLDVEGFADVFSGGTTEILQPANFMSFILAIGFLVGGLMVSSQVGGVGASWGAGQVRSLANRGTILARRAVMAPLQAGRATAVGAVGMGATLMAQGNRNTLRGRFRNLLGAAGARRFVGPVATNALVGLQGRQRAQEEQARNYVGTIRDPRILERLANQRGVTPWRAAVRDASRNKTPSQLGTVVDRQDHVNGMSRENLQRIGLREWAQLGRSNIALGGEAQEYVENNRTTRGAFNEGIHESDGTNWIRGRNRDGTENDDLGNNAFTHANVLEGTVPAFNAGVSRYLRGTSPNVDANAYRKTTDQAETVGDGNLSINAFSRGKSNEIAVDFDAMNLSELRENMEDEFKDIKGVNVIDPEKIKKVSERMVQIIDNELNKIHKVTPNMKKGDMIKIQNLEEAKDRFKTPEKINNLSLMNSSSKGFKSVSDAKKTMVHERIHGYGQRNEQETRRLTQQALDSKKYSEIKGLTEISMRTKPVDEIVQIEDEELAKGNQVDNPVIKNKKVKQNVEQVVAMSALSNSATDPGVHDLKYALLRLYKAINAQTSSIGKLGKNLSGLAGETNEGSTPLEVEVIAQKIKEKVQQ